jgi:hypothetical protein
MDIGDHPAQPSGVIKQVLLGIVGEICAFCGLESFMEYRQCLSRRLAFLLGGGLTVRSTPGRGSRFELNIPRTYRPSRPTPAEGASVIALEAGEGQRV